MKQTCLSLQQAHDAISQMGKMLSNKEDNKHYHRKRIDNKKRAEMFNGIPNRKVWIPGDNSDDTFFRMFNKTKHQNKY